MSGGDMWKDVFANPLISLHIQKISPRFIHTLSASRILPSAACWWERVATTSIQASVALE
jgi:hypothetical protein